MNEKTGEMLEGKHYKDYLDGATIIAVTKPFFMGWPGSVEIAVLDENNERVSIGWLSGLTDEIRQDFTDNNQKYVDQSGHIFKIIGKRKSNFINSIIHFNKKELIFEDCGETISFSVLKDFLINRYNSLDDNLAKSVLIRLTKQSKNIKNLIG